jgi:hypothetical protein
MLLQFLVEEEEGHRISSAVKIKRKMMTEEGGTMTTLIKDCVRPNTYMHTKQPSGLKRAARQVGAVDNQEHKKGVVVVSSRVVAQMLKDPIVAMMRAFGPNRGMSTTHRHRGDVPALALDAVIGVIIAPK